MKIKHCLPLLFFCAAGLVHGDGEQSAQAPALELPAVKLQAGGTQSIDQLRLLLGQGYEQPEFLDVDDAFRLTIERIDATRLAASFAIADGYYLYRDKIHFEGDSGASPATVALPPGSIKTDAYFGEMAVFKHDFSAPVRLRQSASAASEISLRATYQGCAEGGICYAPVSKTFALNPPTLSSAAQAGGPPASSNPFSTRMFSSGPLSMGTLLGAFLAGLLLTFTPCVLPMLPILSAIIAGHGARITRWQGGLLALVYVSGTMGVYAAMGALAGASGEQLQAYFQNTWAIGILAAILLAMALSMFGLFSIQMPAFIQTALHNKGTSHRNTARLGASLPLVFALGAGSAAVIGACVSPILISFLSLAVSAGDPWLGARMMSAMALGMGVPLIALGLGAGHLLPKAGRWMKIVKHVFGVMLIAVAIYLLGALPAAPTLLLWGVFLMGIGACLWFGIGLNMNETPATTAARARGWQRGVKIVGAALLLWGAAALVGGFNGGRDLFNLLPQSFIGGGNPAEQATHARADSPFTRVANLAELEQGFARAAAEQRLVLLDYYADWCVDCARMESAVFRHPRVRETLQNHFVLLQVDVTDPRNAGGKALKKRFGVFGPPAVLFFDRNGVELENRHFYGYRDRADFLALITALAALE